MRMSVLFLLKGRKMGVVFMLAGHINSQMWRLTRVEVLMEPVRKRVALDESIALHVE